MACLFGGISIVELLINNSEYFKLEYFTARNVFGKTGFQLAQDMGRTEVVNLIKSKMPNIAFWFLTWNKYVLTYTSKKYCFHLHIFANCIERTVMRRYLYFLQGVFINFWEVVQDLQLKLGKCAFSEFGLTCLRKAQKFEVS